MTIGADMPLRSPFDALVRVTGKDRGNDQKMPKGNDGAADFKTMVKVALPKLKLDTDDAVQDEVSTDADEAVAPDKDKSSATASPQGVFGQTILAFEQLLQRQRQDQGNEAPATDKALTLEETSTTPAETVLAAVDKEGEQDAALPGGKIEKPAEAMTKPISRQAAPDPVVKPEGTKSQVAPVPAQAPVSDAVAAEAPRAKSNVTDAAEQQAMPAASATASAPAIPVQAEAKLAATPTLVRPQPTTRPQVTDVQILSDRTSAAARTLVIQLQPIELGTVMARLRLTSEGMHIQLTAENRAMAEHLAKDHDALGKALQRAGVADDASSVTISVIDRSSASSNTPAGQQNLSGQEQQAGARANGQGNSGFQGTPGDRSTSQQTFGGSTPDELEEKLAKPGVENNLSRGLVV